MYELCHNFFGLTVKNDLSQSYSQIVVSNLSISQIVIENQLTSKQKKINW